MTKTAEQKLKDRALGRVGVNRKGAITLAKQGHQVVVKTRSPTGHLCQFSVFLDESGEDLEQSHPTDPRRGRIRVPDCVERFWLDRNLPSLGS